jgi:hypothetical protein
VPGCQCEVSPAGESMHVSKETSLRFFFENFSARFFFVAGETGGCWTPTVNLLLIYKIDKKSTNTNKLRKK